MSDLFRAFRRAAASVVLPALVAARLAAQVPDVVIYAAARPDADTAAGAPFFAVARIDGQSGAAAPVLGLPDVLLGRAGGAFQVGAGISAAGRDELSRRLVFGTAAAAAGDAYGVYAVQLDASGLVATSIATLGEWIATAPGEEVAELEATPAGAVLALRTRPAISGGWIGVDLLVEGAAAVGWPMSGAPPWCATGLAYDPADYAGQGGFYVLLDGPPGGENVILKCVGGGGPAELLSIFSTVSALGDVPGRPTSLTICPTGNLIVTHDVASASITAVNRTTGVATLGWRDLWSTGLVACEIDLVRDADVVIGDGAGVPGREVRRLLLPSGGTPETLAVLPSGRATAVIATSGVRMFGRAGSPPGAGFLRAGLLGTAVDGNASFGLRCTNGTPGTTGEVWFGLASTAIALSPYGLPGSLWTLPDLATLPLAFDATGRAELPLPLPFGLPQGFRIYGQFLDPSRPAASAGLRLTF